MKEIRQKCKRRWSGLLCAALALAGVCLILQLTCLESAGGAILLVWLGAVAILAFLVRALLFDLSPPGVPILMYHSVSDTPVNPPWPYLSIPVPIFERQMKILKRAGYHTISLDRVLGYVEGGVDMPRKACALTFDDGFLDSWVNVRPILKKYGFCGTSFVSTDFIDRSQEWPRFTLEELWRGECSQSDLDVLGYLSPSEMRAMEQERSMRIESHTATHTWVFSSPQIVGFHHPGDSYPWLDWNAFPGGKPHWLKDDSDSPRVPFGVPVYAHHRALAVRRFREDPTLTALLVEYCSKGGGHQFFKKPGWREELHRLADQYRSEHPGSFSYEGDRVESEEEFEERTRQELRESRLVLEKTLDRPITILSWPGGGKTERSESIAREEGYRGLPAREGRNRPGSPPGYYRRIPVDVAGRPGGVVLPDLVAFRAMLAVFRGRYDYYPLLAAADLIRRVQFRRRARLHDG